ncbi:hypothetical protein [Deinococcus sp.]|uniref:hypothetical protein n=1 Tax=Deinococcus sp. TaxID=47478 RepID=UPI003CC601EC
MTNIGLQALPRWQPTSERATGQWDVGAQGGAGAALEEVLRRVQATPDAATLLAAQAVLNDLMCSPEGTALVRRVINARGRRDGGQRELPRHAKHPCPALFRHS